MTVFFDGCSDSTMSFSATELSGVWILSEGVSMSEQIFREIKPRFYRKVRVVYQDENKTCAYAIHNGRWSVFDTKNFEKNFERIKGDEETNI
ncbi:hypothetical protein [Escherichia coli]|uniref:hypothetical protein n=1 Tax=Escherichia coli TaxID=562 RepID=UPI002010AAA7|nr:hypothetical protein [Escherichia coli]